MSNKLGPGKPVEGTREDWDCFISKRRPTRKNLIIYQKPKIFVSCFVTQEKVCKKHKKIFIKILKPILKKIFLMGHWNAVKRNVCI